MTGILDRLDLADDDILLSLFFLLFFFFFIRYTLQNSIRNWAQPWTVWLSRHAAWLSVLYSVAMATGVGSMYK